MGTRRFSQDTETIRFLNLKTSSNPKSIHNIPRRLKPSQPSIAATQSSLLPRPGAKQSTRPPQPQAKTQYLQKQEEELVIGLDLAATGVSPTSSGGRNHASMSPVNNRYKKQGSLEEKNDTNSEASKKTIEDAVDTIERK